MSNAPISDSGNVSPYLVTFGVDGISVQSLVQLHPEWDTLSSSEQQAIISQYAASNPQLPPPMVMAFSAQELAQVIVYSPEETGSND